MDVQEHFVCEVCDKQLKSNQSLRAHLRSHQQAIQVRKKYKCPQCGILLHKFQEFKVHVLEYHDVNLEMHFYKFQSQLKFLAWKKNIEERDVSYYVCENKHIRKRNYIIETPSSVVTRFPAVISYSCHRSGYYNPKPVGECNRKRRLKAQGSSKINAYCPSKIIAEFRKKGTVKVIYCSTHMGHKPDASHLRLTPGERKIIAEKIAANVPFEVILDEMRSTPAGNNLTRKHILSRHDLLNIQQSIILNKDSGKESLVSGMDLDKSEIFNESDIQTYNPDDSDSEVSSTDIESDARNGLENQRPKGTSRKKGTKKMRASDKKENSTVKFDSQSKLSPVDEKDTSSHSFRSLSELSKDEAIGVLPMSSSHFSDKEKLTNNSSYKIETFKPETKISKSPLDIMKFELVQTFCDTINKLERTEEIKWVKNHVHCMFDLLKTLKFTPENSSHPNPSDSSVNNSSNKKLHNTSHCRQETNTQLVVSIPNRTCSRKKTNYSNKGQQSLKKEKDKQSNKSTINCLKHSFNSCCLENKVLIAFTGSLSPSESLKLSDNSLRQFSVVQAKVIEPFVKNLSLPVPPLVTKSNSLLPPVVTNVNMSHLVANLPDASSVHKADLPVPPLALIPKEKKNLSILDHDYTSF